MKKTLLAAVALLAAGSASATPSTVVWSPATAYTQPFLVPHISYDSYFGKDNALQTVTGLTTGVLPSDVVQAEVGFDLLYPARDPLFLNAKATLLEDKLFAYQPALTVGVANAGVTDPTNFAMGYALLSKTVAGFAIAGGAYYGFDDDLWVDADGETDQVGALASIAAPAIKVGQPFLDSIVLAADVQTGSNAFSAAGAAASFYFTPSIALLTGPVFFLERATNTGLLAPQGGSDFMWTVQLDVDLPGVVR
jgi:hypothetical protein